MVKMPGDEKVIKHLEMIQAVINRLAGNSFSIKTWSITVIAALIFFTARSDMPLNHLSCFFAIPVILFWALDGYFVGQEKVFRDVYNAVRVKTETDFAMKPDRGILLEFIDWARGTRSSTLILFYLPQLGAIFII